MQRSASGMNTTRALGDRYVASDVVPGTGFLRALMPVIVIQGIAGLAALPQHPTHETGYFIRALSIIVFIGVGVFVSLGSRKDARLASLGAALALCGDGFALGGLGDLDLEGMRFLLIPAEAFLPYALWNFFLSWPRGAGLSGAKRHWLTALFAASAFLVVANVAVLYFQDSPRFISVFDQNAAAYNQSSIYDGVVYGLTMLALPVFLWRLRKGDADEKRRARFFISVLAVTITLACGFIVWISAADAVGLPDMPPPLFEHLRMSLNVLILLNPVAVAYAVVVDEMLPLRYMLRRSLRFLIGKYAIFALGTIPFVMLVSNLWLEKDLTVSALMTNGQTLFLVAFAGLGAWGIRAGGRISARLEKQFFRDRYDLDEAISLVVSLGGRSRDPVDLGEQACALIDSLVQPVASDFYIDNSRAGCFQAIRSGHRLPAADGVMDSISTVDGVQFYGEGDDELARWMAERDIHALLPAHGEDGLLVAFFTFAHKKSMEAYDGADRKLFDALVRSVQLALGSTRMSRGLNRGGGDAPVALHGHDGFRACEKCGCIHGTDIVTCCGQETFAGTVPRLVNDRFGIEKLLGRGGSGEVYAALDLDLRRYVAVKCLIRATPDEARTFRRESIAAAAFSNQFLAAIYDAQVCNSLPVLIFELMENGNLAERLRASPLKPPEVIELGRAISGGVTYLHERNTLHRDIKPANIGFDANGQAKLLDFGLANARGKGGAIPKDIAQTATMKSTLASLGCIGTPLYWSPEILKGGAPGSAADIWALCAVLFESIAGVHPFEQETWPKTASAILKGEHREVTLMGESCPPGLAELILRGLAVDASKRPTGWDLLEAFTAFSAS